MCDNANLSSLRELYFLVYIVILSSAHMTDSYVRGTIYLGFAGSGGFKCTERLCWQSKFQKCVYWKVWVSFFLKFCFSQIVQDLFSCTVFSQLETGDWRKLDQGHDNKNETTQLPLSRADINEQWARNFTHYLKTKTTDYFASFCLLNPWIINAHLSKSAQRWLFWFILVYGKP